ncbi:hypothetical protein AA2016_5803 (plasmid) [Aminobacter aminovorans]|uniref:Uncharacterized protein n=1 Tax=Aminobacter aminovorans TaxID=83263 RepID=A0AAC8YV26_AMIAI|nr:hypothetical protein AA2016_5803 [Aminobacter aminovorans]
MALQPTLAHPSLRDRRDRKRIPALQKPLSKLKPKSPSAAPDQAVQPRPAPPDRALTVAHLHHPNRGPFYAKIRGPDSTVIDTRSASTSNSTRRLHSAPGSPETSPVSGSALGSPKPSRSRSRVPRCGSSNQLIIRIAPFSTKRSAWGDWLSRTSSRSNAKRVSTRQRSGHSPWRPAAGGREPRRRYS